MTFQIEKGIPSPCAGVDAQRRELLKTCAALEVGDSFLAPFRFKFSLAAKTSPLRPKRFGYRSVDSEHIRIWRVE